MKKAVLTIIAFSAMLYGFSQTAPYACVKYFATGNLGGGDCPTTGTGSSKYYPGYLTALPAPGYTPTGKITIYFTTAIPAGVPAPMIVAAGADDGSGNIVLPAFDYKYAAYNDNTSASRTSVVYCYYGSASNQNIFNGAKAPKLAFQIQYQGYASNTCGNVTPVPITLPVIFQSFTATRNDKMVSVKWETATELNNRGFYVQRNVNGEWKDVAFVFSKADGGNSNQILSYAYNDPNNLNTVSYYRILQVDLDGRGKYSETRIVKGLGEDTKLMLFPNPGTGGKINVLFNDETSSKDVIVYDVNGRAVKSFKNIISGNLTIEQLKPGMYSIQVKNNASQIVSSDKFVIQN